MVSADDELRIDISHRSATLGELFVNQVSLSVGLYQPLLPSNL